MDTNNMIDAIKPLRKGKKITPAAEALEELEGMKVPEQAVSNQFPVVSVEGFKIEKLPGRYRLYNLRCHDGIYTVDWSKELLDDGAEHTQEEWMRLTQDAEWRQQNEVWQLPSAPLYHAAIAALYNNRAHPAAEQRRLVQAVREVFQEDFSPRYMMTSTKVSYRKNGKDVVAHDWNTPQARTVQGKFLGQAGYVNAGCGFDDMLDVILESNDLQLIEEAYKWIFGQEEPYLWCLENPPDEDYEAPLSLGVVGIDIIGNGNWPARGVVTYRVQDLIDVE